MSKQNPTRRLDSAFEQFLRQSRTAIAGTERQKQWLAFEAGAKWALGECMRAIGDRTDDRSAR